MSRVAPPSSARSTASAMRGCQCFIPMKTGKPELALERGALASVIASSGERPPSRR